MFHQIPTLAGVLTLSGEGDKGSEGLMLCLHSSCLFLFSASLPVYLLCVVTDRHGNVCLFADCVHLYILPVSLHTCTWVSYVHERVLLYMVPDLVCSCTCTLYMHV